MAPWDLLEQPVIWKTWAREAEKAEVQAADQKQSAEARRAKQRSK